MDLNMQESSNCCGGNFGPGDTVDRDCSLTKTGFTKASKRRGLVTFVAMLVFVNLPYPASAEDNSDPDLSKPYLDRCSEGDMIHMDQCLGMEKQSIDQKLNKTYQKLIAQLEAPVSLKRAQLAWIKFRDLTCDYQTSGIEHGDTSYPYAYTACIIELSLRRIRDLDNYLSADCLGCPPRKSAESQ